MAAVATVVELVGAVVELVGTVVVVVIVVAVVAVEVAELCSELVVDICFFFVCKKETEDLNNKYQFFRIICSTTLIVATKIKSKTAIYSATY